MREVQIKLESPGFKEKKVSLRRARILWIGYYILMLATLSFEISEKLDLNNFGNQNDMTKVLAIVSTFLGLLQYVILAYYQWSLFFYFL